MDLADLAVRCDWEGDSDLDARHEVLLDDRVGHVPGSVRVGGQKDPVDLGQAASARGSATSQAWSGGNLLPAVQCRHVGGGQAGIPSLLVRHPSRAVVDEAVAEHLVDGIVNGLVAHLEHRQQVLT